MESVKWKVMGVNHTLTGGAGNEAAYVVTMQAVPGGDVLSGQLVRRLAGRPELKPGDVVDEGGEADQAVARETGPPRPKDAGADGAKKKTGGAT